jgi:putative ABC transport system ATP-binding protein
MALFQELNQDGITILLVTHEPDIVRYAVRVINFRDGTIRSDQPVSHHADAREVLSKEPVESSKETEEESP